MSQPGCFVRRVLPPGATIAFLFFGLGVLLSEAMGMNLARQPVGVRAIVNAAYVGGCVIAMLAIVRAFLL
jgi:hypothetical protein